MTYRSMMLVSTRDSSSSHLLLEDVEPPRMTGLETTSIGGGRPVRVTRHEIERSNVWSFPERGSWATHRGDYRGNWSPFIPRNLVLRYTSPGETVLDQMMGSGTTLVECKILGRHAIGIDVNPAAAVISNRRLRFNFEQNTGQDPPHIRTYVGDARNLDKVEDGSIDLIATHPPYANIIPYSSSRSPIEGDLSRLADLNKFTTEMRRVAAECCRVLKPGRNCAILIGDTRRKRHHVPLAFRIMEVFMDADFLLLEDIVKLQWHTRSEREKWGIKSRDFLLLAYEHLFVFRKPRSLDDIRRCKDSSKWWMNDHMAEGGQRLSHHS